MKINQEATQTLLQELAIDTFENYQNVAKYLGAHYQNGQCLFGFWLPERQDKQLSETQFSLEILRPLRTIDFQKEEQQLDFEVTRFPLQWKGDFAFVTIEGIRGGSKAIVGDFYQIKYKDHKNRTKHIFDPLAYSIPFGVFAPAEVYDMIDMLC